MPVFDKINSIKKIPIIITGAHNVGKTSIIERYLYDKIPNITNTSHLNYYNLKTKILNENIVIQIWDTSNYEYYLYNIIDILIMTFSFRNILTLDYLDKYLEYIEKHKIKYIILLGNMFDNVVDSKDIIVNDKINKLMNNINNLDDVISMKFYPINVIENINIDNLFDYLIEKSIYINKSVDNKLKIVPHNNSEKKTGRYRLCC